MTIPRVRPAVLLIGLILVYVALATAYAHYVPAWQSPDEPAHFNFIRYLAEHGQLPILNAGDYPAGVAPIGPRFPPSADVSAFRYESHQPPLYYALGALLFKMGARVMALRLLSVLFGALLLVVCYACTQTIFPGWMVGALGAAAFTAFIPMHLFMTASIDNDTLSELVVGLLLLLFLRVVRGRQRAATWPLLGVLATAALLTKVTIYLPAGILVLGTILAGSRAMAAKKLRVTLKRLGVVALITALGSGWWFVRNGLIYGWGDLAGLSRQALVNGSQAHRGALTLAQAESFVRTTFDSFWAQFGWMSVPVSAATYLKLEIVTGVLTVGLVAFIIRRLGVAQPGVRVDGAGTWIAGGLAAVWLAVVGNLVYYNLEFVQDQGRYLYPALIPMAVAAVCGAAGLLPRRFQPAGIAVASLALLWFAVFSLRHDIIPAFSA